MRTGTFREEAQKRSFTYLDGEAVYDDSPFQVGDLLLAPGHIVMLVQDLAADASPDTFNPYDPRVAEAWIDENGDVIGPDPRDTTGVETRTVRFSAHPYTSSSAWYGLLRWSGTMEAWGDGPVDPLGLGLGV